MGNTPPSSARLSAEKRRLFAQLLKAKGLDAIAPLPRITGMDWPLSFAQQRLWFLDRLEPDTPRYNVFTGLHLAGPLDRGVLERSLTEILRRHQVLRARIVEVAGEPIQRIGPLEPVVLPLLDLADRSAEERRSELIRLATEEARRPFGLASEPPIRCSLVRCAADEHVLLLSFHHIASDAWSLGVVTRELTVLYEAFAEGASSPLPELEAQYGDFAAWQRERLQGEVFAEHLSYWRRRLEGIGALALPTDRPRPPVQSFNGAWQSQLLDPGLAAGLKSLSQREDVTLFMTLLAAFQVLLGRYTGGEDIAVGTPVANRNRPELEALIGYFGNMLVVRTDLSGDPTFRELLGRVREVAVGAYAHQELPFEKLVEELRPHRDLSRNPIFQVAFALQQAPFEAARPARPTRLRLGSGAVDNRVAKFDLTLYLSEAGGRLVESLEYNTDLFAVPTIERMLGHFRVLLEGIVANPDARLSALPILAEKERTQLLGAWCATATDYPRDACVHHLFETQAAATPEVPAVTCGDRQLSYGELNRRSNRLAHHLRALGVGPEVRVGICLDRSPELVVGLLAILKAGGAYVPLDPDYPRERLRFMLGDAGVRVLVTRTSRVDLFDVEDVAVVCLDRDELGAASEENPAVGVGGDNLAYVIYTSGSTGTPKGVAVTHRAINRLVINTDYVSLEASDRIAQASNASFDAATFEVWGALLHGARLVILSKEVVLSVPELAAQIREQGITTLFLTTALFNRLAVDAPGAMASLRQLLFGGEAVDAGCVRQVLETGRPRRLLHVYGPTESTTFSTWYRVDEVAPEAVNVPIGRPIANTTCYVLDPDLNPVPVGVPGELFIGADGLARGYLGRPEITAETFVPDPFASEPGGRLYRTGDLVQYRPDGNVEFLGRKDLQVKMRGFRIELGEIESTLARGPGVKDAAVIVREDHPGDKRLVAYLTAREGQVLEPGSLREHLKGRLPEYMVPSALVILPELPLTPNGKLDRRALPAPDTARPDGGGDQVAPRDPIEDAVALIWRDVLGLPDVGVHDDFFELGGHSLLATQVISRLRDTFRTELPLRALFEAPTVAGLAAQMKAAVRPGPPVPPILPVPRDGVLPLALAQRRLWLVHQLEPTSPAYNLTAAMELRGVLDAAALERGLDEVVRRHEALRTTFVEVDGQPAQVVSPAAGGRLAAHDLRALPEAERELELERHGREEALRPFDLARGPLFRATLLRLGEERHVLLLAMHHIVTDAWSFGLLSRELAALYAAFRSDRASPLAELPVQYPDFACWQQQRLREGALDEHLAYWRERLAGVVPLELPTDHPRPRVQTFRGGQQSLLLSAPLSLALRAFCRREGVTPFMTLLAAFKALLHRYTGQSDFAVGAPIANRNRSETEGLIGFFVNTLVLRTDLSGRPSFRALAHRVQETALGAYAHPDLPFDTLVEALNPARDLSRSPLFQVVFALQNAPVRALELAGLEVRPRAADDVATRFDLEFHWWESGDRLAGTLVYNRDVWEPATMARFAGHFQALLEAALGEPERAIGELDFLAADERRQLLAVWGENRREYPRDSTIAAVFADEAERTPEAVALVYGDERLSYRELNRRANRLARRLRKAGVGPEVRVAICVERSPDLVVGLLGILKAGGAYLPLDPGYPRERLAFMLEDSRVPLLLTEERLLPTLPAHGARVLCLDRERAALAAESSDDLAGDVTSESLAYVIYTSGSTGRPKGVEVCQRGVLRLVLGADYVELGPGETLLHLAPVTFDASTLEVWGALLRGGTCVLSAERVPTAKTLAQLIERERVSTLWLTASLYNAVVDEAPEALRGLRQLLIGGEALSLPHVRRGLEALPETRLINGYGPTETTTFACCYAIPRPLGEEVASIPIGRPIANTRVYVLDGAMNPVPIGVVGELFIGGDGNARGYARRPDLTAERFVPDPFAGEGGGRLYRTGDRVRYRPDGTIEFLGRLDGQVKVRGFRIELGEIETLLRQHPGVRDSAVIVREDQPGDKRIVAYLVAEPGADPAPAEVRALLREKLPEYMVPSTVVRLEELPLDSNGKLDRRALPAPEAGRSPESAYVAPTSELEELVAGIWRDVLATPRVGIHDNFFDLGGHSLLLIRAHRRLCEALPEMDLTVVALFEHPTVASLAVHLGTARDRPGGPRPAGRAAETREQSDERLRDGRQRLRRRREIAQGLEPVEGADV